MSAGITYNDDLLMEKKDQEKAERRHPLIYFALNHEDLRNTFSPVDAAAGNLKSVSRRWGLFAVGLVVASLITAAAQPYYHESPYKLWIAGLAALAGVVGGAIGLVGIFFSTAKRDWLERRMITERLRQLHFQILIAWAPLIVEAASSEPARERFMKERRSKLDEIDTSHVNNHVATFSSTLDDEAYENCWMVKPIGDPAAVTGEAAKQLFEALRFLRIDHQQRYASSKLTDNDRHFWGSPVRQVTVMSAAALMLVAALIVFDIVMLIGVIGFPPEWVTGLHVATVATAIIALALRTVEQGFRSHGEVERYRHYSASIRQVTTAFEAAPDAPAKLAALAQLEAAAYEEMVTFLKSNKEARYIM